VLKKQIKNHLKTKSSINAKEEGILNLLAVAAAETDGSRVHDVRPARCPTGYVD
jgi:hypothetical protein